MTDATSTAFCSHQGELASTRRDPRTYSPDSVFGDDLPRHAVVDTAIVVSGAALTGHAAIVAFHTPLAPDPLTLQTLSVLLVAAAVGPMRAVLTVAMYLGGGAAGVSRFAAHSSGWGDPTFGYLPGFLVVAVLMARPGPARRLTQRTHVGGGQRRRVRRRRHLAGVSLDVWTSLKLGLWPS